VYPPNPPLFPQTTFYGPFSKINSVVGTSIGSGEAPATTNVPLTPSATSDDIAFPLGAVPRTTLPPPNFCNSVAASAAVLSI
jgi:hypothetical protein